MTFVLVLGVVLAGISIALALHALLARRLESRDALAQIGAYGFGGVAPPAAAAGGLRPGVAELVRRAGARLEGRFAAEKLRDARTLLNSAGYYRTSVAGYLGYRLLAAVGAPLAFLLLAAASGALGPRALLATVALAGLGWVLPPFLLERRARQRVEEIDREVPELVDLLVTTVEAGVGFGTALQISARRIRGPLGHELRVALREQTMGLTMDEALRNLLSRTGGSSFLRAFVQAILQGETLGVSVGRVLHDLAADMRKRRRRAAEERAQKAPTKLLFPLVFLILPAMFVIVLSPAVYAVMNGLGSG